MASDETSDRERVRGIGGVFIRTRNPVGLAAWYERHLGVPREAEQTYAVFTESRDAHVWSVFKEDTDYWPAEQQAMVNYVVRDLDAMLDQLRGDGAEVDDSTHEIDGIGRFGWATDPEGNRFELWEPTRASRRARGRRRTSGAGSAASPRAPRRAGAPAARAEPP